MHRANRSAPWKERSRARLAPDFSLRKCQKGGSRLRSASTQAMLAEAHALGLAPVGADPGQELHFGADLHLIEGGARQVPAAKAVLAAVWRG